MAQMSENQFSKLRQNVSPHWEKPLHKAAFVLLVCHFTLLSSKVPQQTSGDANPFAVGGPDDGRGYGATVTAAIPAQPALPSGIQQGAVLQVGQPPQQSTGQSGTTGPQGVAPAGPAHVVLQSMLAADPRAMSAFAGEPGWAVPAAVPVTPRLTALSFAGGGAGCPSPVRFPGMTNIAVCTVLFAARGDAADLATLVDAPETARLRIVPAWHLEPPDVTALERALTEAVVPERWEVPGRWKVLAVDFAEPADLAGLFFGGGAGRPGWLRNWRGEIAELAAFDAPPDKDTRAGVANYFAIRWGFGGYPATHTQRDAARAAGLHSGVVWGSVLIIK